MRVVIAPDKFAGSLPASEVAAEFHHGWSDIRPGDDVVEVPLSDGGPGFIDCLATGVPGQIETTDVSGPMREPTPARTFVSGSDWYIESAQACGLHLVDRRHRDPMRATTFGVGELIRRAVAAGAQRMIVGLGGSATNDAGAGLLAALGAVARNEEGAPQDISLGPAGLIEVADVDVAPARAAVAGIEIVIASDVDNPLLGPDGASRMFGPQKGATPADIDRLESILGGFASCCAAPDLITRPGAGAAGGLGFGLMLLGGERQSGIDLIMRVTGLARLCDSADLVITGEGRFDEQSLHGKVVSGVVSAAGNTPVLVVAGQSNLTPEVAQAAGVAGVTTLLSHASNCADAIARAAELLRSVARDLARSVS